MRSQANVWAMAFSQRKGQFRHQPKVSWGLKAAGSSPTQGQMGTTRPARWSTMARTKRTAQ